MKKILILIFSITLSLNASSTVDCIWTSKQKGIKFEYVAPCEQKYQKFIDSLLRQILSEIVRSDTLLKIEVYINSQSLFYRESSTSNYVAISYDLLGKMNDEAIFNYYWSKQSQFSTKFDTRLTPININFGKDTSKKEFGLKIIFNADNKFGVPKWDDLKKLIIYSIKNISEIKKEQKLDTIGHCCNDYFVSILTLDSTKIKTILYPKVVEIEKEKRHNLFYIISIILVIGFVVTRLVVKKHSS